MRSKKLYKIYCILGLAMIVELAASFYTTGVVQGMNHRADILRTYAIAYQDDKTILPGQILDRNGKVLADTDYRDVTQTAEDGSTKTRNERITEYADGKAYSQLIGYTGRKRLTPTAITTDEVIGDRNDSRLMAILDDESWGENGLYRTVDLDGTRGQSAVLTINHDLQMKVYEALAKQMSASESIGSAIVMDVKTGEILADVCFPAYDLNDLEEAKAEINRDAESTNLEPGYPVTYKNPEAPGSIFKVLTSVALIEHGMEDFTVENTPYTIGNWTCNASNYNNGSLRVAPGDEVDLETALNISSNIYFSQAALALGSEALQETADRFMLKADSSVLSLDFGDVRYHWDLNVPDDALAQTGFGQGKTELTTVYAAMIAQAIANDGKMMKPYMIRQLVDEKGKVKYQGEAEVLSEATDKKTADIVTKAMRSTAVETCRLHNLDTAGAIFDKYHVAGKTGTAENGDAGATNNAWYMSFAPAEDPQYVVVVNHCRTHAAGYSLMNTVAEIYDYLLQ